MPRELFSEAHVSQVTAPKREDSSTSAAIDPEVIRGTTYYNFSGRPLQEILHWFPSSLKAEKIVLLPDLCPGRSPLPTGCCVEINQGIQPDWRSFAVSDVGCGMQVLKSVLNWEDFEGNLVLWDDLLVHLKKNKGNLGDLGSGNHFLDAAVDLDDPRGRVYFIIHTGSRDESAKATNLIDKPRQFDSTYSSITSWARNNRDTIADILQRVYGKIELVLDKTHNFYKQECRKAIVYKGAVELKPGEMTIIPSSMEGDMVMVTGTAQISKVNNAMSHGTGRLKSRGESKEDADEYDLTALRKRGYIPTAISDASIRTENPSCYRSLDNCLQLLENLVEVQKRLTPIAYIGQL